MDRFEVTKRASLMGILGNIFLLIIKSIVGILSNSQAMIADSINSASDIFASAMTSIGNKIASVPEDESHNFGHGKAEYIFSLLISLSMIIISMKLFYNSIMSLINKEEFTFSPFLVIVCIITIIVKFFLYKYTKKMFKQHNNILLEANYKDHRNDCIVTTFTLISILLGLFNIYWFDGVVGLGISVWIFYTGLKILIESYNILMDISIDSKTKNIILDLAHECKEIKNITDFYTIPTGYQYVVILTIHIDGNMSTFDSHKLADNLEKNICNIDKINRAIIHVNPI
mgnify:FL=1